MWPGVKILNSLHQVKDVRGEIFSFSVVRMQPYWIKACHWGCVGEKCVGIDWSDRHKPYITYVTFYLIVLYVYLSCICRQNYHEDNEQESVQSKAFFETSLSACTFTFFSEKAV